MPPSRRPVAAYAALLGATILLGLATRASPAAFPSVVAQFGGDVLWAAMVVWILALLRPAATSRTIGLTALSVAVVVELSQLWRVDWLDALRATRAGALVLGQGFLWSDLVCYAAGVSLAVGVDVLIRGRSAGRATT